MLSITDRNGNTLAIARDSNSNATQITSPNGRWIALTYDSNYRITQASDELGRTVLYSYDSGGRLTQVTDANGGIWKYAYDSSNNMTSITDPRSITYLTNKYDSLNRVSEQDLANGGKYQLSYNASGCADTPAGATGAESVSGICQTTITDPNGSAESMVFNAAPAFVSGYVTGGTASTATMASGTSIAETTTNQTQTGTNQITSATDALGRTTTTTYDNLGNVLSVTRLSGTPNAVTTTFAYESTYSQLTSVTDPLGHTTSFNYDPNGNLIAVTDPLGNTTKFTNDSEGRVVSATDPAGETTTFAYTGADVASVKDPLGRTTSFLHDAAGRLLSVTSPLGQLTRYGYNPLDQITSITDPLSGVTSFTYDGNGNLLSVTDPKNTSNPTKYAYESMDRLQTRTDPLGNPENYAYDKNGNLTSFTDRRGKVTTYNYDALNRLSFAGFNTRSGPTYDSTINYTYDLGNRLTKAVDSIAGTFNRTYDGLNRLTQKSYNDNKTPAAYFVYDQSTAWGGAVTNPVGRLTTTQTIPPGSSTAQTATLFGYDPAGRVTVTEECQPQNCSGALVLPAQYTYDLAGDVLTRYEKINSSTSYTITNTYNAIQQLAGIASSWSDSTHPATLLTSATYSAAGEAIGDTLGNRVAETRQYNKRLWPTSIAAGSVYSLSLGYLGNGSVSSANDSVNGNMSFTYDNLNRLATMSSPSNPSGCYGLSWSYDSVGNRTAQSVTSGTCPASSLGFGTSNQITSPSGYHYDAAGNMTNDTVHSYTYDAEGRILTVDGGTGAYVYDAFGRRIEKTTGGTSVVYLYDLSGREIAVVSTAGTNLQDDIYVGSRHLAMYANNTTAFYDADQVGTERIRTTVSGAVDETCTSLPFGDNQSCTGAALRFAGYERDNEYGLAHAPARYYSPTLGRFMTPDPLNGGAPQVSYSDPGLAALSATLRGHVLAPLRLSTTRRAPGPQVQSLGGQVPLAAPGCQSCGCSAASAGGNTLTSPQTLNRYPYVLNSPALLVDPTGTDFFTQLCLDICFIEEVVCETTCVGFDVFVPPPFDFPLTVACVDSCVFIYENCLNGCTKDLGWRLLAVVRSPGRRCDCVGLPFRAGRGPRERFDAHIPGAAHARRRGRKRRLAVAHPPLFVLLQSAP